MVGNSNCRWHWIDKPGAPEPEIPWCGLLWPDATPVSLAEAEAVSAIRDRQFPGPFLRRLRNAQRPRHGELGNFGTATLPVRNAVTLESGIRRSPAMRSGQIMSSKGRPSSSPAAKMHRQARWGCSYGQPVPVNGWTRCEAMPLHLALASLELSKINNGAARKELATYDLRSSRQIPASMNGA